MKRTEISTLLPGVFQRTLRAAPAPGTAASAASASGGPLDALLEVMEMLHAPSEAALADLAQTFDPRRTRDEFVPFLARWVDLDRIFEQGDLLGRSGRARAPISTGLGRLRELTARAAWLSKWRGTLPGLRRFLQIATGEKQFEIRENVDGEGRTRLFHFTVAAPKSLTPHRALLERIIESEKPAYTTYDLVMESPQP